MAKGPDAFRTISEVARELGVPQHVLRFWESRFSQVRPMKRGGGRRYYRQGDIALLKGIHRLLYGEGFTIRGVQKILRERGIPHVVAAATGRDGASGGGPGNVVELKPRPDGGAGAGDDRNSGPGAEAGAAGLIDERMRGTLRAAVEELGALRTILDRARK
jgi:DNA-binding transcriptional MerR regulator